MTLGHTDIELKELAGSSFTQREYWEVNWLWHNQSSEPLNPWGPLAGPEPQSRVQFSQVDPGNVWYESMYSAVLPDRASEPVMLNMLRALIIDFDSVRFFGETASQVSTFLMWLYTKAHVAEDAVGVYFSGKKGFHVVLPVGLFSPEEGDLLHVTPASLKQFVMYLCGSFSSVDMSVYDSRRLFRIEGAPHPDTGIRKKKITIGGVEVLGSPVVDGGSMQTVVESLKDAGDYGNIHQSVPLTELFLSALAVSSHETRSRYSSSIVPLPSLFEKVSEGDRHNRLVLISSILAKQGADLELSQEIAKLWNRQLEHPMELREVGRVVKSLHDKYSPK